MFSKVGLTEQHGSCSVTLLRGVLPGLSTSNGDSTHDSLDAPHTVRTGSWEQLCFLFWLWPLGNMTPFCKKNMKFLALPLIALVGLAFFYPSAVCMHFVLFHNQSFVNFFWDHCCHLNICCWLNSDIKFNFFLNI